MHNTKKTWVAPSVNTYGSAVTLTQGPYDKKIGANDGWTYSGQAIGPCPQGCS